MSKTDASCPKPRAAEGSTSLSKQTEWDKNGRAIGTHYQLDIDVSIAEASMSAVTPCVSKDLISGSIVQVYVPFSTNQPQLKSLDIKALNEGLNLAGSPLHISPKAAEQAKACFAGNLARMMVEMGSRCAADEEGGECLRFGSDTMNPSYEGVTLTGLDAVASVIQQGIAQCQSKGRSR